MRLRWIFVLALLAAFFGWKYIDDDKKGFEIKRTIDFKGVVERMKESLVGLFLAAQELYIVDEQHLD